MTFSVTKEIDFHAGHRIPHHKSKCFNPHGHTYRVVVMCQMEDGGLQDLVGSSEEAMVIDFSDLKTVMMERIYDPLDHGFMVDRDDKLMAECFGQAMLSEGIVFKIQPMPGPPTAETIAKWCYDQLDEALPDHFIISSVEVFETPTSSAVYEP